MAMPSFQHVTPPLRLFAGTDCLKHVRRELDRLGSTRAVVFCGNTLSRDLKLIGLLREAIGERLASMFSGVKAHSPLPAVLAAAEELRRVEADAVIAVGGGSAVATARAASIVLAEGKPPSELCTRSDATGVMTSPRLLAAKMPQLIIPTTATTACVKAGAAVFDLASGRRLAMFDPKARAQSIFLHPDFLASSPRQLMLQAVLDGLVLAVEGLLSRSGSPISDALLMHAVRLAAPRLAEPGALDDPASRSDLMMAAILCGQGTDQTGAGVATVLGHVIGVRHHVANGIVKAVVLPEVLRFNAAVAQEGLRKVAVALEVSHGTEAVAGIIEKLAAIFSGLALPRRLREIGVQPEEFADIAVFAMSDWLLRGSPRRVLTPDDLVGVMQAAW